MSKKSKVGFGFWSNVFLRKVSASCGSIKEWISVFFKLPLRIVSFIKLLISSSLDYQNRTINSLSTIINYKITNLKTKLGFSITQTLRHFELANQIHLSSQNLHKPLVVELN